MITADQFIASGVYKTILVVGAEKLSSIVNWKDRNTCVLFGDGAGAVVLQHRPGGRGLLGFSLGADGSQPEILTLSKGEGGDDGAAGTRSRRFIQMTARKSIARRSAR